MSPDTGPRAQRSDGTKKKKPYDPPTKPRGTAATSTPPLDPTLRKRKTSLTTTDPAPSKATKQDSTPAADAALDPEAQDLMSVSFNSGVISDDCSAVELHTQTAPPSSTASEVLPTSNHQPSARLDLASLHPHDNLPISTRKILISSTSDAQPLSRINPYRVGKAMDALCGPVDSIDHKRSGALIVTTKTLEQAALLLRTTEIAFYDVATPVRTTVAWNTQLSYGKIYAPELQEETLDFLLSILQDRNVVGIRKLLSDPKKSTVPLYVLTFLSPQPPPQLTIGYCHYTVDKYHPSPMRCSHCFKYGHSRARCSSTQPTCGHCSVKGHSSTDCPSLSRDPVCTNCRGAHLATSRECPAYRSELRACHIIARDNVSFPEARQKAREEQSTTVERTPVVVPPPRAEDPAPNPTSEAEFPSLTQFMAAYATAPTPSHCSARPTCPSSPTYSTLAASGPSRFTQSAALSLSSLPPTPSYHPPATVYDFPGSQIPSAQPPTSHSQPSTSHSHTSPCHSSSHSPPPPHPPSPATAPSDIFQLLLTLLPTIIRLILAPQVTDKVECLIELGRLLHAESIVASSLLKLGHTSLLHSQ